MTTPSDATSPLTRSVSAFIDRHDLLPAGPVVVALSGGPDSLCLLHLLADLAPRRGWSVTAAHVDHGLRPESAAEVEAVRAMAATRAVPLRTERVDVPALAAAEGDGIEAAARRARYHCLATVAADLGGATVAVGHTQDDQAETLLLRLARGAGLTGLAAMRPLTLLRPSVWGAPDDAGPPLRVVRPLLATGRAEVEAELARRGLTPLRDPSNADPAYARNRLRHQLLPAWQALDPGIAARLARAADLLAADEEHLDVETERIWQSLQPAERSRVAVVLDRAGLLAQSLATQRRLLRRAVRASAGSDAPTMGAVDAALTVIAGPPGGQADLAADLVLLVEPDAVWIGPRERFPPVPPPTGPWMTPDSVAPLATDGATLLPGDGCKMVCRTLAAADCRAPLSGIHAHFSLALADAAPVVRTWRPGDRIALPGLGGHKKLSDFFIDRKVSRAIRPTVPLVVADDTIAWIVGHAVGEPYRATGEESIVLCCTAEMRDA